MISNESRQNDSAKVEVSIFLHLTSLNFTKLHFATPNSLITMFLGYEQLKVPFHSHFYMAAFRRLVCVCRMLLINK